MKDTVGMLVSGLCLVHCLLAPVLLALGGFGVLGVLLGDELFHLVLLVPALILALASFPLACRRHRRPSVMLAGLCGVALLVLALGLEGVWELVVSVCGAGLLVSAHWANRQLLRRCLSTGQ